MDIIERKINEDGELYYCNKGGKRSRIMGMESGRWRYQEKIYKTK